MAAKKLIDVADATKVVRDSISKLQLCIGSIAGDMDEPIKAKWQGVDTELQTILASIKATEEDNNLKDVIPALTEGFQVSLAHFQSLAEDATKKLQAELASLPSKIEEGVKAKVTSGEYILKADHDKAIGDATSTAATAARTAALADHKRITDRRLQLTTASMPVPGDDILAKEDAEFEAAKTAAQKRLDELKPFSGLAPDRQLALAWNTDEAGYQSTLSMLKEVVAKASKGSGANPFINRGGSGSNATAGTKKFGLC